MMQLDITVKPDYNRCCGCIDAQVWQNIIKDCKECEEFKDATLYEFIREKGKTYGIISYEDGILREVELWRIRIARKE